MIKLMREAAHRYPWILQSLMAILAIAFIVGMGWWGFGNTEPNAIASVGDQNISRDEYRRAYENTYRFYKDNVQGDFKEEMLKQYVLDGLIESRLWTIAAEEMGVTVTPEELRDDILKRQDFQRNGKFDPDLYTRLLAANRLTPAMYESLHATDLMREKARRIVREAVALTPSEIAEAQSLMARQSQIEGGNQSPQTNERLLQDFLFQKQQRALMAYTQALKARVPIQIHKELL
ncbi:SurA N-terminal domain-containing protein [Candidatus Nitrospira bockiana]